MKQHIRCSMNLVYNFNETGIPLWIKILFWGLYIVPFLFLWGKVIYDKKIKIPKTIVYIFFSVLFAVVYCIYLDYLYWLLYIIPFLFLCGKVLYKKKKYPKAISTYLFISFFALFAVFYCINSDYFAYRDWIYGRDFTFWTKEQIYVLIILLCKLLPTSYPYEVFRLLVWGSAIVIVYLSVRQYKELLNPGLVLFFLFVLYSSTFCYARASLAMAVFFAGLSLFFHVQGRLKKILAIILAVFSYFFHHEMIIGIGLLPCLFLPFENRKVRLLLLAIFIIGLAVVSYLISDPAIFDKILGSDEMSNKIESFNEMEQRSFRLSTLVSYLTYYFPLFMMSSYFRKDNHIHIYISALFRITCGIIALATIFVFVVGIRSIYTYRILFVSMIPLSIMLSHFYNKKYIKKRQLIVILILALLSNSVRFINSI